LSTAWPARLVREEREEIDWHRKECGRVMLAGESRAWFGGSAVGARDLIARDLPALLKQLNGRQVDGKTLKTANAENAFRPETTRTY
jgi:hypothetical protein